MSTETKDGGPAFPTQHNVNDPRSDGFFTEAGMSLRDWFAGQALAAVVREAYEQNWASASPEWIEAIGNESYRIADSVLAARTKEAQQ